MDTKYVVICVAFAIVGFIGMQVYFMQNPGPVKVEVEEGQTSADLAEKLAPVIKGNAVLEAGLWDPLVYPPKCTIVTKSGKLHKWHEKQKKGWKATNIEETQLLIVVGDENRELVKDLPTQGLPKIKRYRYDREVWLMDPYSGKSLAHTSLMSYPRPIREMEPKNLKVIGDPISFDRVEQWLRGEVIKRTLKSKAEAGEYEE